MLRRIEERDRAEYIAMCRDFYSGGAVCHSVPDSHFESAFDEMIRSDAYLEGYVIESEGRTAGYMLFMKSWSQEAGGSFAFLDELYVKPEYRGRGLGREALAFAQSQVESDQWRRVRLEVTHDNGSAKELYRSMGYQALAYEQMYIGK